MSYRLDINSQSNTKCIVIDGFENGIALSPYDGIGNIRNLNTSYYPGVAYVNYRRQACTIGNEFFFAGTHSTNVSNNTGWSFSSGSTTGEPLHKAISPTGLIYILDNEGDIFKQSAVNSTTFNLLGGRVGNGHGGLAYWNNYLVVFGDGFIEFCGDGTGDSTIISTNWNKTNYGSALNSTTFSTNFAVQATWLIYISRSSFAIPLFRINDPVTFTTTGTLPAPLVVGTTYYIKDNTVDSYAATTVSATIGGAAIILTTDGTGTHTITDNTVTSPIGNCTNLTISSSGHFIGDTTGTIISYINAQGVGVSGAWREATGIWNIVFPDGNEIPATFTNNSATVAYLNPLTYVPTGNIKVNILNTSATTYKTLVSKVDGNLYFANGRWVGRISSSPNSNFLFNPANPSSFSVNYSATGLLQSTDTVVDLVDLQNTQIIAGNKDIYPWDYVSAQPSTITPVGEQIYSIINILSNVYITAGQKGNIYMTNGYSAQFLTKIPDFIAGVIDPVWAWGDLMFHRAKLFFQSLAYTTAGTTILAGIFSYDVENKTIVMEAQNSSGLVPTTTVATGVLIDNTPSANGNDSYYSGWGFGTNGVGGIDYNDTTLWQNYEPVIETDIIPIGTILEKQTFGNIEFKLDRPLANGDGIRLSWRPSLTDSYTVIGTTTATASTFLQLSNYFASNISQAQWAQFKVEFKCASSSSSFVPLREIRLNYGNI